VIRLARVGIGDPVRTSGDLTDVRHQIAPLGAGCPRMVCGSSGSIKPGLPRTVIAPMA
jgi:hypothetical protein